MKLENRKRVIDFYDSRFDQFGNDVRSLGWGDVESQRLRFKILTQIADLSGRRICDLGCGFGDLSAYLREHFKDVDYLGVDLSSKLIGEARRRYPGIPFEVRDILEEPFQEKYDYVLSSGALSFKMKNHEHYIECMLNAMMAMSKKGVAVNFLSSYADYQLDKNFHLSPEKAIKIGRTLTPFITIRHDYPLYEFTMYLYHNEK